MISSQFRNLLAYRPAVCNYLRPWTTAASQRDYGSTVAFRKDQFEANLDVGQFKPEEISVKVTGDNTLIIEGKHEENRDAKGFISRHFIRTYMLPKGHDLGKIESKLSSDGILTITAPRIELEKEKEREIPIKQTGEPIKKLQNQSSK